MGFIAVSGSVRVSQSLLPSRNPRKPSTEKSHKGEKIFKIPGVRHLSRWPKALCLTRAGYFVISGQLGRIGPPRGQRSGQLGLIWQPLRFLGALDLGLLSVACAGSGVRSNKSAFVRKLDLRVNPIRCHHSRALT